jgi:hypothetical protein
MERLPNHDDARKFGACIHCGGLVETRDHLPSKVLLDDPLPDNVMVVPAMSATAGFPSMTTIAHVTSNAS